MYTACEEHVLTHTHTHIHAHTHTHIENWFPSHFLFILGIKGFKRDVTELKLVKLEIKSETDL